MKGRSQKMSRPDAGVLGERSLQGAMSAASSGVGNPMAPRASAMQGSSFGASSGTPSAMVRPMPMMGARTLSPQPAPMPRPAYSGPGAAVMQSGFGGSAVDPFMGRSPQANAAVLTEARNRMRFPRGVMR
jgi:hypothetical protein